MAEIHQYIGELTTGNVDRYLTSLTRKRIAEILTNEGGLNADVITLRAGCMANWARDALASMLDDGTVVRLPAKRDADGNVLSPRGLYLHDGDAG